MAEKGNIQHQFPMKWHFFRGIILLIFYWTYKNWVAGDAFGNTADFLTLIFFHVPMFYLNALLILPKVFKDSRKVIYRAPLCFLLEFIILLLLMTVISFIANGLSIDIDLSKPWRINILNFFLMVFPLLYGMTLSFLYYGILFFYNIYFQSESQNADLKDSIHIYRQAWRKAQLNPHLLRNLMSSLRYITLHTPKAASEAMGILIKIMRYYVENSPHAYIPLMEEVDQVKNLIRLNEIRFERKTTLQFHVTGEIVEVRVIPMLLVPIVVNIFKHAVLGDSRYPAKIYVTVMQGKCYIYAENWVLEKKSEKSTGNGLKNLQDRLNYFYPDRHFFEYGMTGQRFTVALRLWEA